MDNLENTNSKQVKSKESNESEKEIDPNVFIGALKKTDFVNVSDIDKDIKQVKYFRRHKIYSELGEEIIAQEYDIMALRLGTALKLSKANKKLIKKGYNILLYDAYRSYDVQNFLRNHYKYLYGKLDSKYIATPGYSNHQKGASVDIGLYDFKEGKIVPMPTEYLVLNSNAVAINNPVATLEELNNLKILQDAMESVGFTVFEGEWWHFDDWDIINKVSPLKRGIENRVVRQGLV